MVCDGLRDMLHGTGVLGGTGNERPQRGSGLFWCECLSTVALVGTLVYYV